MNWDDSFAFSSPVVLLIKTQESSVLCSLASSFFFVKFSINDVLFIILFEGRLAPFVWLLDCSWLNSITENPEFRTLPCFLFGESLGGAVALKMHLKQPNAWSGACLVAPMCKVYFQAETFYRLCLHSFSFISIDQSTSFRSLMTWFHPGYWSKFWSV